jgi:hypothetical protein
MRFAFKEWAVVVDALGRGDQIIILRKGGISEEPGGFKVDHPDFLLFPTRFHQQRESVLPRAQERYDGIAPHFPPPDLLRMEYHATVADWKILHDLDQARSLRGQHIWKDQVIEERFDWGKAKCIVALAVRVYRLEAPVETPMLPAYGGCKSWIEIDPDIGVNRDRPVLSDEAFGKQLARFRDALRSSGSHPVLGAK